MYHLISINLKNYLNLFRKGKKCRGDLRIDPFTVKNLNDPRKETYPTINPGESLFRMCT